ncbi:MAG: D-arabinose 5-phosphate isomerase [Flavobacteriales bacterium TMED123]|nr:MAG: D-arabinose 5-phosphate isomerase [Flavobacteriales bacterium TMED123]
MKSPAQIIAIAKSVIRLEAEEINALEGKINDAFVKAVSLILSSEGRVIVAGVGKSANIASKIVATLNSTGQPAVFLHAADAIHGDLGNIQKNDIVICISKSGNTEEIKYLLQLIKNMGNAIIAICGNNDSYLANQADCFLDASIEKEACPHNLAPTSSTTAQLVLGDALAVCLLKSKNFSDKDFARFHPGGTLGKRLYLKAGDIVAKNEKPTVQPDECVANVIIEISQKRLGAAAVLEKGKLIGIITDGDLRRMLEKGYKIDQLLAKDIMNNNPKSICVSTLAIDALKMMENHNVSQLIVVDKENYIGIIHMHDIIKEGIA